MKKFDRIGLSALAGFMLTIPVANWMIGNVGTFCVPDGPCLIPIAPGIMAPSGVLIIGLALVLRDVVHSRLGARFAVAAIIAGAALSGFVAPSALIIASATAFLVSEMADLAVYTPLYRRRLIAAVVLSGMVGAVVDSGLFLWLAFGSLDHMTGQVIGKVSMSVAAIPFIFVARKVLITEGEG